MQIIWFCRYQKYFYDVPNNKQIKHSTLHYVVLFCSKDIFYSWNMFDIKNHKWELFDCEADTHHYPIIINPLLVLYLE